MNAAAAEGKKSCSAAVGMTPEQLWMRDPREQCKEELLIYREIAQYVFAGLEKAKKETGARGIITEGAAYLPVIAKEAGIPAHRYISVTPTAEFQLFHYSRREWVPYVLEGCKDKAKAFENWMERDILFAEDVRRQCRETGYVSFVSSGETAVGELISKVAAHFGLE